MHAHTRLLLRGAVAALAVGISLGAAPRALAGQICGTGRTQKPTLTVTPTSVALASPVAADFNAGASQTGSYTITVRPGRAWTWYLCIQATSANMGTVNGYTKPIGDLQYSFNGGGWTSLTPTVVQLIAITGRQTYTLLVRTALAWANDQPSTPTVPFTYTANFNIQAAF